MSRIAYVNGRYLPRVPLRKLFLRRMRRRFCAFCFSLLRCLTLFFKRGIGPL